MRIMNLKQLNKLNEIYDLYDYDITSIRIDDNINNLKNWAEKWFGKKYTPQQLKNVELLWGKKGRHGWGKIFRLRKNVLDNLNALGNAIVDTFRVYFDGIPDIIKNSFIILFCELLIQIWNFSKKSGCKSLSYK